MATTTTNNATIESSKKAAGYRAVKDHLEPTCRHVGIGSGSTVVYVVEAIAALGKDVTSSMKFYSTGEQSKALINGAGLEIAYIEDLKEGVVLDVAFDGADEVDEDMNLIKGGGACLYQEKLVALAAKKFVCVADFRKISTRLGTKWKQGIPIEVLPKAAPQVLQRLKALGSQNPKIRSGLPGKAGSIVTDNGGYIIDAPFPPLLLPEDAEAKSANGEGGVWTVDALAAKLKAIDGINCIGLFFGHNGYEVTTPGTAQKPVAAYFGMEDGSVKVMSRVKGPA